jgi:hypothetical protein
MRTTVTHLPPWEQVGGTHKRVSASAGNTAFGGNTQETYTVPAGKRFFIYNAAVYNLNVNAAPTNPQPTHGVLYNVTNTETLLEMAADVGDSLPLNQPIIIESGEQIRLTSYQYGAAVNFHGFAVYGYLV